MKIHNKMNQRTVSTAKRLASLASPIDTLHKTINGYEILHVHMEFEVQCTCMYDPNKC